MRKWMRDRLQRRKKKAPESAAQPAPPPLQPAYFDEDETSPPATDAAQPEMKAPAAPEPEVELQPDAPSDTIEASRADTADQPPTRPAATGDSSRTRGRRRRGGRGRGGRGREQAVAQAFTPAAAKGIIPEVQVEAAVETGEEAAPESEPETVIPVVEPEVKAPKVPVSVPVAAPRPGRKASWFLPSACPAPEKVRGSSGTTSCRSPATWCGRYYSTTCASSVFRISCSPTFAPCLKRDSSPSVPRIMWMPPTSLPRSASTG